MKYQLRRAVVGAIALVALSAPAIAQDVASDDAAPSDCPGSATGTSTGQTYTLTGQSVGTDFSQGSTGGSGSGSVGVVTLTGNFTYTAGSTQTYNIGHYTNTTTGERVQVNCSSGVIMCHNCA